MRMLNTALSKKNPTKTPKLNKLILYFIMLPISLINPDMNFVEDPSSYSTSEVPLLKQKLYCLI